MRHALLTLVCALGGLAVEARASVWIVDAAGGGQFTDIQPCIDVAVDGDTILVRTGSYGAFVVPNKALRILAESGASVQTGGITVRTLEAHKDVLLARLHAVATAAPYDGILMRNNAGSIRVEDCVLQSGVPQFETSQQRYGAEIQNSADVTFRGCILRGGDWSADGAGGMDRHGLAATGSRIAAWTSIFEGGGGNTDSGGDGCSGGYGAYVRSSFVFGEDCDFVGGDGGDGAVVTGFCTNGGDGGPALWAILTSEIRLHRANLVSGVGGNHHDSGICGSCCSDGFDPPPTHVSPDSTFENLTLIPVRALSGPNPVVSGGTAHLSIWGGVGDEVRLVFGTSTLFAWRPNLLGVSILPMLAFAPMPSPGPGIGGVVFSGTIGPTGRLDAPLALPAVAPGSEPLLLHVQALHRDVAGFFRLGGAASLIVLP